MSPRQEIALGLSSAPQMAQQFGGADPDPRVQQRVQSIGNRLVRQSVAGKTDYEFSFHVLRDGDTVNAFALPGGPVFITRALLYRLGNEAQLAGVLAHEIGHVVARHSSEHMAKSQLAQTIVGAATVAGSDRYGGYNSAMIASFVANMVQMKYGRNDELESDRLGVRIMSEAGYDPRALIGVMDVLEKSSGGGRQPEFFSTHPNPGNRRQEIARAINGLFPNGVPTGLTTGEESQEFPADDTY